MNIERSSTQDIDTIFRLYEAGTKFQTLKQETVWPKFDRASIQNEIEEGRQWKITIDNQPCCVWVITFNDPEIWGERDKDPSIYIHRIATDPNFRGRGFVTAIVDWAKEYAAAEGRDFVRLDTAGENTGLIGHYTKCGFSFLGLSKLADTTGLPAHYHEATVSLFEIKLKD
jgi:ribosomal protein S18 acetylase RimI-like enzyme